MANPTQYGINSWIKGVNGYGLPFCNTIQSATLAMAADTSLTVPGASATGTINSTENSQFVAIFSYSAAAIVYVALNATAAVPGGAAFAATTSSINPAARVVKSGDVIHFISAAAASVTVEFYAIQVG